MRGARLWKAFGIADKVTLQINSLGSNEARAAYKEKLVSFLQSIEKQLDEDSQRRMTSNPLRVLDSKNPDTQALLKNAPRLIDHLDAESELHFKQVCEHLDALGIQYEVNPALVRGLDYYNRTVFEWVTDLLGAQGTICAGGRYDNLVAQLGAKPTPAVGFAMGIERLVLLIERIRSADDFLPKADVYITALGANTQIAAMHLAEELRDALPELGVVLHCGGGNLKKQMKKADASGANVAIIIGESELEQSLYGLKYLRNEKPQEQFTKAQLLAFLSAT